MTQVFGEERESLSDGYLDRLLSREEFWAIAAFSGEEIVGGLTAHCLPMTRSESSEIMVYDIAVREDYQRKGIGRLLIATLLEEAAAIGIHDMFVPADSDDQPAIQFYQALDGIPSPVTIFTFSDRYASLQAEPEKD